jgi:hypothetical protein
MVADPLAQNRIASHYRNDVAWVVVVRYADGIQLAPQQGHPNRPTPSGGYWGRRGLHIAIAWTVLSLLAAATLGRWAYSAPAEAERMVGQRRLCHVL